MGIQAVDTEDRLARFRNLPSEPKPKMTDRAKDALRSLNEHHKRNAEADTRLVKEFNSRTWTLEQLTDLFASHFGGAGFNPRRRAIKALYRLLQGPKVYTIADVSFLGELLPGEDEGPLYKFLAKYPLPEDAICASEVAWSNMAVPKKAPRCSDRQKSRNKSLLKSMVWRATKLDIGATAQWVTL